MPSLQLSRQEAAIALLKRRSARQSLAAYIDYLNFGVTPAAHHRLVISELEALERGEVSRLMLLLPPGSAKSTYGTVLFPPWFIGRNEGSNVLGCSNTTTLAEHFSRRSRNIVSSSEHSAVFGETLAGDSAAAGSWETTRGSSYFAAGVGATITGRRADLGVIDDPVKSREDADSELIRQKHWDWYVNDYLTRLKPGARQVLIQTRWHEDDLAGRILARDGAKWRVVKLPMIAGVGDLLGRKPGERLWPEWFTDEMVQEAKLNPRSWSALYQQEPSPDEGTFFRREWFKRFDPKTAQGYAYTTGDFAVTEGAGDFTELGTHKYFNDTLYLCCDGWHGQTSADTWIEQLIDQFGRHKPLCFFGESGPIRRAIEPFLTRRMAERKTFCRLEWLVRGKDKPTMARSLQAMAAAGKVQIADTEYGEDVLSQLLQFPAGTKDDAVDMAALMGMALADAHPGVMALPPAKRPVRDPYERDDDEADTWKVA